MNLDPLRHRIEEILKIQEESSFKNKRQIHDWLTGEMPDEDLHLLSCSQEMTALLSLLLKAMDVIEAVEKGSYPEDLMEAYRKIAAFSQAAQEMEGKK